MRKIIIILFFFVFYGCSKKENPTYTIISIDSNTARIGDLKEGDILSNKEARISLAKEESILLRDISAQKVYRLSGPFEGSFSEIEKTKFVAFNEKYFSLINQNIRKPEKEIKQAVLGGVFRASSIPINYMDGEILNDVEISIALNGKSLEDCDIKIFKENLLIHNCDQASTCTYNLEEYVGENVSSDFEIKVVCGLQKAQRIITLPSKKELEEFKRAEAELSKANYPELARINFYLEQKRFSKVKSILEHTDSKSPFILKLKKALS